MKTLSWLIISVGLVIGIGNPLWAGGGLLHSIGVDTARNNCWPDAFVPSDRASVRMPFVTMVANGWMKQNLIADHLFDESGQSLTEAGRRKVQWIVTQAPLRHRTIYVKKTLTEDVNQARINAVLAAAKQVIPPDQKVDIRLTDVEAPGWPAEYVDHVERSYYKTMPEPRLPPRSSSETESSGSSSN